MISTLLLGVPLMFTRCISFVICVCNVMVCLPLLIVVVIILPYNIANPMPTMLKNPQTYTGQAYPQSVSDNITP